MNKREGVCFITASIITRKSGQNVVNTGDSVLSEMHLASTFYRRISDQYKVFHIKKVFRLIFP